MKSVKVFLSLLLSALLFVSSTQALALSSSDALNANNIEKQDNSYVDFLNQKKDCERPNDSIVVLTNQLVAERSANYEVKDYLDKKDTCICNDNKSVLTFKFSVEYTGLYNLSISNAQYGEENITNTKFDVLIDGKVPFDSAKSVSINKIWELGGQKNYDSRGNELLRNWTQKYDWNDNTLYDCEGRYNNPLCFYLTNGSHTVTLDFEYSGIAISALKFFNENSAEKYTADNEKTSNKESYIIEGEDFSEVNDSTIALNIEKNDPEVTPNNAENMKYNTVGGESFSKSGQSIVWNLDVKESGYYYIAFKARQNIKKGFFSSRKFQIDGKTPFAECENICFTYSEDWQQFILSNKRGKPIRFYIESGETHELSLSCIPGEFSESMTELDECIEKLNHIFLQVRMVVGNSADKYRDYYLTEDIPELTKEIKSVLKLLIKQKKTIQKISRTTGGDLSSLQTIITQLISFDKKPDQLALKLDTFKSNISSLSAWVSDLKTQPLEIDKITVASKLSQISKSKTGFFKKLLFKTKRLFLSFTDDYGVVGDVKQGENLKVWISTGQDQLDIVRNLIIDKYKGKANINLQLVTTGLLEAAMAGKGPDIAMYIAGDMPVNLASRGGLVDLSRFETYNEVMQNYMPDATKPYMYNGGCYALPLSQGFPMLFVRTDIFKELGLSVPNTWDEFFNILPILQRNNLEAGIPSDLSTFATFAIQNGGTYFNKDLTATTFDNFAETSAFIRWTELFSEKGLPLSFDFSNRFRTGEMPIGIADYSAYAMLETSAPEISGRWSMYPVMATVDENGNLNRAVCCATIGTVGLQQGNTCAVMLKNCKDKKLAWEFLSWFTSTQIQTNFGLELEKRMGVAARYAPANKQVLANLPWSAEEQGLLYSQWKNLYLLPEIPGSYYVTRNLNNAFRKSVYNSENPTHTLSKYNEIINQEIARKRKGISKGD